MYLPLKRKNPPTIKTPPKGPRSNPALAAGLTYPTKQIPVILSPSISPKAIVVIVKTNGKDQATK